MYYLCSMKLKTRDMEKKFDIMYATPWDIIFALDLNEQMSRDEVAERIFSEYRELYDGQVPDVVIADMCESTITDVYEQLMAIEDED